MEECLLQEMEEEVLRCCRSVFNINVGTSKAHNLMWMAMRDLLEQSWARALNVVGWIATNDNNNKCEKLGVFGALSGGIGKQLQVEEG